MAELLIVDAFALECSGQRFVVPVATVEEIVEVVPSAVVRAPRAVERIASVLKRFRVQSGARTAVDWRRVNLVEPAAVATLGAFDVVLCRNVLIYFDDAATRAVIDGRTAALRPGASSWWWRPSR